MSLHLEFEPHSWYMGFAIKDNRFKSYGDPKNRDTWEACTDDGNTYQVVELGADTLKDLKQQIKEYRR